MATMPRPIPLVAIGQHPGSHDHPLDATPRDHPFLPRLVPEVQGQNHWNDKERVVETHASGTVSDTEGRLADQAWDTVNPHGAQDVSSPIRKNASWIEIPLVAKGGQHRFLTAHSYLYGTLVEHITLNHRQLRMVDLKP